METTAQNIVNTAIAVFNDDLSANLETVALRAGVTRRTLHRYFKDRLALLDNCKQEMMSKCKVTILAAHDSSTDPLKQLENMLYAAIDCGSKYAFLNKLYQREGIQQVPDNTNAQDMETITNKWLALIMQLQKQGQISDQLTPAWILELLSGMTNTTINAFNSGNVAPNDIKKFAWFSFSRSIGIELKS
nr:TetR/AcrR family transcriptional regulator [Mucilaginibacter sp. Bleaf8]